jgi:sigma-E factor negative regulatory protein RseC
LTTEEGVVLSVRHNTAMVKTTRSSACEACSAKSSCHSVGGGKDMEVEALNQTTANVGDRVLIGFETASLYKAAFLLYVFPIIAMLGGGLGGAALSPSLVLNESVAAAIGAFLCFGVAFVIVRLTGTRLAEKTSYKPKIIRVLNFPQAQPGC